MFRVYTNIRSPYLSRHWRYSIKQNRKFQGVLSSIHNSKRRAPFRYSIVSLHTNKMAAVSLVWSDSRKTVTVLQRIQNFDFFFSSKKCNLLRYSGGTRFDSRLPLAILTVCFIFRGKSQDRCLIKWAMTRFP